MTGKTRAGLRLRDDYEERLRLAHAIGRYIDGDGVVEVDFGDATELLRALLSALEDPETGMTVMEAVALETTRAPYDPETVAQLQVSRRVLSALSPEEVTE